MSTVSDSLSPEIASVLNSARTQAYLAGEWTTTGQTLEVHNPATGQVLVEVTNTGADEFLTALAEADRSQDGLRAMPARERGEVLRRTYELMIRDRERLATLITLEMGKPLAESRGEVTYAAEFFRWFSEEAARISGDYRPSPAGNGRILVLQRPVGPCLFITPWNFPLAMGARKIAPAFAAGCPSITKPAELTPLSMLALAELLEEAGAPAGSISVLPTSDASASTSPVISDPRLRKLSFTGSTPVGQQLIRQSADQVLRVSMELGGNAPFIVFEDADLDAAVDGAMLAKLRNGGEACTSANRMLVHESVVDQFTERLVARMQALVVGPGTDDGVDIGPLIDLRSQQRVVEWVSEAEDGGAQIHTGGRARPGAGWFFEPTVITGVAADSRLDRDEIFAPVAPIRPFSTEDEAIEWANNTRYGLVSYIYTEGLARGLRVCEALETGMVGLNRGVISDPAAPFGGVKHSGLGREGGREGIHEFLETTYVGMA